jgi:hypothetical protein
MSQPETPPQTASQPDAQPTVSRKGPSLQKLWVPVVIIIGFLLGEVISYYSTETEQISCYGLRCPPFGFGQFPHFENDPTIQFHIVLTTISIALLVALLLVYVRMYAETKANFSLGLVVVLFALLLQALLSYPIVIGFIGSVNLGPGLSSQFADVFTVCAYAIFLYLSLE